MQTEPALIIGMVQAVLVLVVAFGVKIDDTQSKAILAVVQALVVLAGAFVVRSKVYAPDTVESAFAAKEKAHEKNVAAAVAPIRVSLADESKRRADAEKKAVDALAQLQPQPQAKPQPVAKKKQAPKTAAKKQAPKR